MIRIWSQTYMYENLGTRNINISIIYLNCKPNRISAIIYFKWKESLITITQSQTNHNTMKSINHSKKVSLQLVSHYNYYISLTTKKIGTSSTARFYHNMLYKCHLQHRRISNIVQKEEMKNFLRLQHVCKFTLSVTYPVIQDIQRSLLLLY